MRTQRSFFEPPYTELFVIHMAAIDDLVVAAHIAPKFIGKVKYI
jgi:hypothetical protein